ncbi:MAG: sulfatase, partial [Alphaproteobacteria bacterium]|nr:sulfatase [Alphaproteobacteria bacterium]
GHESSRFTYRMARIPLIVNLSEKFTNERKEQVENMKANAEAYWTNDLLYNLMISLMNIKGVANIEQKFDLLSDKYNMTRKEVKLLHGQKDLSEEK